MYWQDGKPSAIVFHGSPLRSVLLFGHYSLYRPGPPLQKMRKIIYGATRSRLFECFTLIKPTVSPVVPYLTAQGDDSLV